MTGLASRVREGVTYLESCPERIKKVVTRSQFDQDKKQLRRLYRTFGDAAFDMVSVEFLNRIVAE